LPLAMFFLLSWRRDSADCALELVWVLPARAPISSV
jgi:hypothetical protein